MKQVELPPKETKLSLRKSIRVYCVNCCGNSPKEVALCPSKDCALYKHKEGKGAINLKTVKEKCLDCSENYMEYKYCEMDGIRGELCPLWWHRIIKKMSRKEMTATLLKLMKKPKVR